MVKTIIEAISSIANDFVNFTPPGLAVFFATVFINDGKYLKQARQEFVGTLMMIAFTFSAGKWVGKDNVTVAWISHFLGVIASDFLGGGPQVNPACTLSMWCLGKVTYTEAYVRVAAQMGGGLVAFPLYHMVSNAMNWTPFGGPEFKDDGAEHPVEAFLSEFCATVCLMFLIYTVNWEINFGKHHYVIKQSLTAIGIRALIELFPTAGPAMNPMLATAWFVFGVGNKYEFPVDMKHYTVYWIAPGLAAILASFLYVVYAGGTMWGTKLPIGPFKPKAVKTAKKD